MHILFLQAPSFKTPPLRIFGKFWNFENRQKSQFRSLEKGAFELCRVTTTTPRQLERCAKLRPALMVLMEFADVYWQIRNNVPPCILTDTFHKGAVRK